ncbi:MAG: Lrp/AsnC family transcriptional regulator [Rhodobiaceae bacterium]|nr:Lrp/AsnC family transcriptional regulator [Rhodobiaceae bacterium]
MAAKLDSIDWQIIAELQKDGRITNVALAERVGISAPPCLRRVRTLEEEGYIVGYHAEVDNKMLGYGVSVYAMIGLHSQSEAEINAFVDKVNSWPLVREATMLSGDVDFLLRCVAPDMDTFQRFVIEELTAAPNVESVRTSLVLGRSKFAPGVPVKE